MHMEKKEEKKPCIDIVIICNLSVTASNRKEYEIVMTINNK